jgi:hypothetical protein
VYRPFRDFLNAHLTAQVQASCPGFDEIKSLARAGGFTRRRKLADGRVAYIFMTTVPQRERFMVSLGWANDGKFKAWDELASRIVSEERVVLDRLRSAARLAPSTLWQVRSPGVLVAADVNPAISLAEIETGDGVPWDILARHVADSEAHRSRLGPFLSPFIIDSLRRGEVPPFAPPDPLHGLNEPYRCKSPLVSWETWHEFVLQRPPSAPELAAVLEPAMAEANRQIETLAAVANAMVNELHCRVGRQESHGS